MANGIEANDLYFMAMCYYRQGDAAKAREYFEQAMASHQRNAERLSKKQSEELNQFRKEAATLLGQPVERR
jgi:Tfp pilus assembly protein PilF